MSTILPTIKQTIYLSNNSSYDCTFKSTVFYTIDSAGITTNAFANITTLHTSNSTAVLVS